MQLNFSMAAYEMRQCRYCHEFQEWNGGVGWHGRRCPVCHRAEVGVWRIANPEMDRELNRRKIAAKPELYKEIHRRKVANRREHYRDLARQWRSANAEHVRAGKRRRYAANPNKQAIGMKHARRRRARKANAVCEHGVDCFYQRAAELPRRCAVQGCRRRKVLHADHIVPLSGGGKHCGDNCQILCGHHNKVKSAKPAARWAAEIGRVAGMKALDLFCGAGGVAVGLLAAGYEVTGIDIADQPDYPGRFIHGDVLDLAAVGINMMEYDLVWASPPCNAYSSMTWARKKDVGWRSIPPTRNLLAPHPVTIIENVWGAGSTGDLRCDVTLDYQMFRRDDPPFQRRRIFEVSFPPPDPPECRPWSDYPPAIISPCTRDMRGYRERRQELGLPPQTVYDLRSAFGADWILDDAEAPDGRHGATYFRNAVGNLVPPEYARWLGERAADHIAGRHYDRHPRLC